MTSVSIIVPINSFNTFSGFSLFPCSHRNSFKTFTNERPSPTSDLHTPTSEMTIITAPPFCVHRRDSASSCSHVKWKAVVTSNPHFLCSQLSTHGHALLSTRVITSWLILKKKSYDTPLHPSLSSHELQLCLCKICSSTKKTYQQNWPLIWPFL